MQIFRLIIKKQHYYLLIYRKTIMFARKIPGQRIFLVGKLSFKRIA